MLSVWDFTILSSRSGLLMGHVGTSQNPSFSWSSYHLGRGKTSKDHRYFVDSRDFSLMGEKTYHSCYKEASEPLSLTCPKTPGHTWKARFGARGTCFKFWLLLLPTLGLWANHSPYMSLGFLICWWGQYEDNSTSLLWSLWSLETMCIQHTVPGPTYGKKAATVTTAQAV